MAEGRRFCAERERKIKRLIKRMWRERKTKEKGGYDKGRREHISINFPSTVFLINTQLSLLGIRQGNFNPWCGNRGTWWHLYIRRCNHYTQPHSFSSMFNIHRNSVSAIKWKLSHVCNRISCGSKEHFTFDPLTQPPFSGEKAQQTIMLCNINDNWISLLLFLRRCPIMMLLSFFFSHWLFCPWFLSFVKHIVLH